MNHVSRLAEAIKAKTILDYGCGKRLLEAGLTQHWKGAPVCKIINYDPCIEAFSKTKEPSDLVCCIDVLEHVEPDFIDDVLDDIEELTLNTAFLTIANRPAKRFLSDGRNAHVLQKPYTWWIQKLSGRYRIKAFENIDDEGDRAFWFICDHAGKA